MRALLIFFIVAPACEIGVLLLSGKTIGVLPTVLLIILTGFVGAYLAKRQGIQAVRNLQKEIQYGRIPSNAILDAMAILVGGIMLLTPGFISDIVGLFLLFPITRNWVKPFLIQFIKKWIDKHTIHIIRP
ncbi:membrane protein FxsA [Aeribacillus pallidus]|uniref:FxsA family protein n=1 Tax=Aeribacillus TaxID=1055323 RepID=UPI0007B47187|nr:MULTISPECIES: FxsA family protein [Aeribacillus]KZM56521.1 exlusion protein FxsA [Aeribacillus pallidus]MED0651151.1 membrane protein FxsA [Aeribacillus composti]MED4486530.1 membrane protein FxsA [Aeribacillus pallidus]